jgi:hypothetical protein
MKIEIEGDNEVITIDGVVYSPVTEPKVPTVVIDGITYVPEVPVA